MSNPIHKMLSAAVVMVSLASLSGAALADDTAWQKSHPRREQVNNRLANQNRRIHQQVKQGDLTHAQAAQLHQSDHQIRQEERAMASQNGGHISKPEQKVLNQQENAVSQQIGH